MSYQIKYSLQILQAICLFVILAFGFGDNQRPRGEKWQYDPGPDVNTEVGKGYAKIFAETPNFRKIGEVALPGKGDKFRWKFGPMFYRGRLTENGVKVLIIGQEGAQEENVSFRSFTGGTGGRMQHFLSFLGLNYSYLFVNTFVYTITGQYADYAPRLQKSAGGTEYLRWADQLTYPMLKLAQIPHERFSDGVELDKIVVSPVVEHRHKLLDHVFASNKESLRLVVAVGGAAQDTLATYIQHRGGTCEPTIKDPKSVRKVKYGSVGAGGNRRFFFPVDEAEENLLLTPEERETNEFAFGLLKGQEIYFVSKNARDKHPEKVMAELKLRAEPGSKDSDIWQEEKNAKYYDEYVAFSKQLKTQLETSTDGPYDNGFEDIAQLTMDLESCQVMGKANSLKGLKNVDTDVRFVSVMHPGSNSPRLLENFTKALSKVRAFTNDGWELEPDTDSNDAPLAQPFDKNFVYSNKPVPYWDFRFGQFEYLGESGKTTTTRRDGGRAIELGTDDRFDNGTRVKPRGSYPIIRDWKDAYRPEATYMRTDLGWEPNKTAFTEFDPGPGEYWAKVFTGADRPEFAELLGTEIFEVPGLPSEARYGSSVFYRGNPSAVEVLVLADQFDHDDMWVGRALMGHEGQRLQNFLAQIGVTKDYCILRTFPVDTLGADGSTIAELKDKVRNYQQHVVSLIAKQNQKKLKLVIARGQHAKASLFAYAKILVSIPKVVLGDDYSNAFKEVASLGVWQKRNAAQGIKLARQYKDGAMPIPRADIPFGLPRWVGTAGDRVIRSEGKFAGRMYKIVAPEWSTSGQYSRPKPLSKSEIKSLKALDLLP